ncbi:conserved hypothetical protein [Ricinus communis]|uniref:Uncharacterized protein n=1 Tax=Ricinus communis TaxID=3988 RepID=B9S5N3_RICCO|nr:conserved hypothetical protein [Ricinus communis]
MPGSPTTMSIIHARKPEKRSTMPHLTTQANTYIIIMHHYTSCIHTTHRMNRNEELPGGAAQSLRSWLVTPHRPNSYN